MITGNIDNPGGLIIPVDIQAYEGPGWSTNLLTEELRDKKCGVDKYPMYKYGSTAGSPDATIETLESGEPYQFHGAWIQTCNSLACCGGHPERLYNAMKDLDFIVMIDPYMTPTAMALADIMLPVCFFPERNGIALTTGSQRAAVMVKVVEPKGESKSDMQICFEVGKRIAPEHWPWATVEEMFDAMLEDTGYSFAELKQHSPVYPAFTYHKYAKGLLRADGQPGFSTETGRIELYSTAFEHMGLDPLPYYAEPVPGPISTPELFAKYPLILITGTRRWPYFHSEHRGIERLRKVAEFPEAELHPDDAARFAVESGDWIWLENDIGRAKRRVVVTKETLKGTVTTDHGWWYPEGDAEDWYGVRDVNINNLLAFTTGKSGFGTNFKANLCTLYKVEG
jgi:anaerobic selenocysteine-containing dehydrogenase